MFSSKGDRLPTYRVALGKDAKGASPKTPYLQTDIQMYVPGNNGVDAFEKYALKKLKATFSDVSALWQLAQALLNCLKIVWIPLDEQKDDAQAIFESLNDKGRRLTASELLCNYLFRPIMDDPKENSEDLHNNLWLAAIRLLDDHFDEYLRHLFSIGENKMLGKDRRVYVHFKGKNRQMKSASSKQHLADIFSGAVVYQTIIDPFSHPHDNGDVNLLLIAIANTRMDSSTPFVLSVLRAHAAGTLSDDTTRAILHETLVLLVRRKMTELKTTQYDIMFPSLLGNIINDPNPVRALQERFKKPHDVWISDHDFEEALKNKPTYRRNDLAFSRMLLMEIDKKLQTHGQFPDYGTVGTIEHMIPQTLDGAWRKYLGSDADDEHLEAVIDTIGNLCLLSGPANSSVGQDPFESKKTAYSPLTALARQIKEHKDRWDIKAVRDRSQTLAKESLKIWAWANV